MDDGDYTAINLKPLKYGVVLRITRELMEDSKFDIMQAQLRVFGKRFAENENSLVTAALDGAGNTVAGGAAITIPNLTRALQFLEDNDFNGTDLFVGAEVLNDLRNIDTFVEFNKSGSMDMLERGFLGTIYGLKVLRVSTNAGMTTTTAYVIDRSQAYAIAEKRALTIENFDVPTHDMSAAALTHRVAVTLLRANAVARITTT
jgi:HK97 family phage major capsid protein